MEVAFPMGSTVILSFVRVSLQWPEKWAGGIIRVECDLMANTAGRYQCDVGVQRDKRDKNKGDPYASICPPYIKSSYKPIRRRQKLQRKKWALHKRYSPNGQKVINMLDIMSQQADAH